MDGKGTRTMSRIDNLEEMPWLGGEAHVRPSNSRPQGARLWLWLVASNIPALVGAAVVGVVLGRLASTRSQAEDRRTRRRSSAKGAPPASEQSESREPAQVEDMRIRDAEAASSGSGALLAGFGLGVLAGAVVALLTTPEPGSSVRRRMTRGLETARRELDEVVDETNQSWSQVRDETCHAVVRTAAKMKEAAQATTKAVADDPDSTRKTP
jgi:gas vesicle protein